MTGTPCTCFLLLSVPKLPTLVGCQLLVTIGTSMLHSEARSPLHSCQVRLLEMACRLEVSHVPLLEAITGAALPQVAPYVCTNK
jgi:hypothetical protein